MNLERSILVIVSAVRMAVLILLFSAAGLASQSSAPLQSAPEEFVRKAVKNEIDASSGAMHFMFRGTKTTPKGSTTKLYVETSEGTAGMAVAYDGKRLTEEQRRDEESRLEQLSRNPEEMRKRRKQQREDDERTLRIMRALPDAFLYEYAGEVMGSAGIGHVGDPLVKLKFRPNPNYRPPSRVENVLTGMQGELLLDAVHYRIASIDGALFKEVGFGWGILGHLDRGGHFVVHQEAVEDDSWEISSMNLKFTGKILLVKSLFIDSTEVFSDFKRVSSDLTFAQAVEMLKKEETGAKEGSLATSGGRR